MNKYLDILESIDFHKIKDHPNILIAANFWEEERYKAAKTCYKYLRAIDDLIDGHKSANKTIADEEKNFFKVQVGSWINSINGNGETASAWPDLMETIVRFQIPVWPMEFFARSMIYDINNNGFNTFEDFLEYSQGASVAPASIFVHLAGITKHSGEYTAPVFDVRSAATPCAIFSYIVHIIRDFQKDQQNNLNYFARNILARNDLDFDILKEISEGGKITPGFRSMIGEYCSIADSYRRATWQKIVEIKGHLQPRYRLSLMIIFNLYMMVFERINIENGSFTTEELNPTPEEIKQRVLQTIQEFTQ